MSTKAAKNVRRSETTRAPKEKIVDSTIRTRNKNLKAKKNQLGAIKRCLDSMTESAAKKGKNSSDCNQDKSRCVLKNSLSARKDKIKQVEETFKNCANFVSSSSKKLRAQKNPRLINELKKLLVDDNSGWNTIQFKKRRPKHKVTSHFAKSTKNILKEKKNVKNCSKKMMSHKKGDCDNHNKYDAHHNGAADSCLNTVQSKVFSDNAQRGKVMLTLKTKNNLSVSHKQKHDFSDHFGNTDLCIPPSSSSGALNETEICNKLTGENVQFMAKEPLKNGRACVSADKNLFDEIFSYPTKYENVGKTMNRKPYKHPNESHISAIISNNQTRQYNAFKGSVINHSLDIPNLDYQTGDIPAKTKSGKAPKIAHKDLTFQKKTGDNRLLTGVSRLKGKLSDVAKYVDEKPKKRKSFELKNLVVDDNMGWNQILLEPRSTKMKSLQGCVTASGNEKLVPYHKLPVDFYKDGSSVRYQSSMKNNNKAINCNRKKYKMSWKASIVARGRPKKVSSDIMTEELGDMQSRMVVNDNKTKIETVRDFCQVPRENIDLVRYSKAHNGKLCRRNSRPYYNRRNQLTLLRDCFATVNSIPKPVKTLTSFGSDKPNMQSPVTFSNEGHSIGNSCLFTDSLPSYQEESGVNKYNRDGSTIPEALDSSQHVFQDCSIKPKYPIRKSVKNTLPILTVPVIKRSTSIRKEQHVKSKVDRRRSMLHKTVFANSRELPNRDKNEESLAYHVDLNDHLLEIGNGTQKEPHSVISTNDEIANRTLFQEKGINGTQLQKSQSKRRGRPPKVSSVAKIQNNVLVECSAPPSINDDNMKKDSSKIGNKKEERLYSQVILDVDVDLESRDTPDNHASMNDNFKAKIFEKGPACLNKGITQEPQDATFADIYYKFLGEMKPEGPASKSKPSALDINQIHPIRNDATVLKDMFSVQFNDSEQASRTENVCHVSKIVDGSSGVNVEEKLMDNLGDTPLSSVEKKHDWENVNVLDDFSQMDTGNKAMPLTVHSSDKFKHNVGSLQSAENRTIDVDCLNVVERILDLVVLHQLPEVEKAHLSSSRAANVDESCQVLANNDAESDDDDDDELRLVICESESRTNNEDSISNGVGNGDIECKETEDNFREDEEKSKMRDTNLSSNINPIPEDVWNPADANGKLKKKHRILKRKERINSFQSGKKRRKLPVGSKRGRWRLMDVSSNTVRPPIKMTLSKRATASNKVSFKVISTSLSDVEWDSDTPQTTTDDVNQQCKSCSIVLTDFVKQLNFDEIETMNSSSDLSSIDLPIETTTTLASDLSNNKPNELQDESMLCNNDVESVNTNLVIQSVMVNNNSINSHVNTSFTSSGQKGDEVDITVPHSDIQDTQSDISIFENPNFSHFICTACPYTTKDCLSMENHIFTHSEQMPITCGYCSCKYFSKLGYMTHCSNTHRNSNSTRQLKNHDSYYEVMLKNHTKMSLSRFYLFCVNNISEPWNLSPVKSPTKKSSSAISSSQLSFDQTVVQRLRTITYFPSQNTQSSKLIRQTNTITSYQSLPSLNMLRSPTSTYTNDDDTSPDYTGRYVCTYCMFSVNDHGHIVEHVTRLHSDDHIYTCSYCESKFTPNSISMEDHLRSLHPDKPTHYKRLPNFFDREEFRSQQTLRPRNGDDFFNQINSVSTELTDRLIKHYSRARDVMNFQDRHCNRRGFEADSTTSTTPHEEDSLVNDVGIDSSNADNQLIEAVALRRISDSDSSTNHFLDDRSPQMYITDLSPFFDDRRLDACRYCGEVIGNNAGLKHHLETIHNKSCIYSCVYCDAFTSRTECDVYFHIRKNHSDRSQLTRLKIIVRDYSSITESASTHLDDDDDVVFVGESFPDIGTSCTVPHRLNYDNKQTSKRTNSLLAVEELAQKSVSNTSKTSSLSGIVSRLQAISAIQALQHKASTCPQVIHVHSENSRTTSPTGVTSESLFATTATRRLLKIPSMHNMISHKHCDTIVTTTAILRSSVLPTVPSSSAILNLSTKELKTPKDDISPDAFKIFNILPETASENMMPLNLSIKSPPRIINVDEDKMLSSPNSLVQSPISPHIYANTQFNQGIRPAYMNSLVQERPSGPHITAGTTSQPKNNPKCFIYSASNPLPHHRLFQSGNRPRAQQKLPKIQSNAVKPQYQLGNIYPVSSPSQQLTSQQSPIPKDSIEVLRQLTTSSYVMNNQRLKNASIVKCPKCYFTTTTQETLRSHIITDHTRKFVCPYCPTPVPLSKYTVPPHIQSEHPNCMIMFIPI